MKKLCVLILAILSLSSYAADNVVKFAPKKEINYQLSVEVQINGKRGIIRTSLYNDMFSGNLIIQPGIQFEKVTPVLIEAENLTKGIELPKIIINLDETCMIDSIQKLDRGIYVMNIPLLELLNSIFPKASGKKASYNDAWKKTSEMTYYLNYGFGELPPLHIENKLTNKYTIVGIADNQVIIEMDGGISIEGQTFNTNKTELKGTGKVVEGRLVWLINEGYFAEYSVEYEGSVECKKMPIFDTLEFTLRISLTQ